MPLLSPSPAPSPLSYLSPFDAIPQYRQQHHRSFLAILSENLCPSSSYSFLILPKQSSCMALNFPSSPPPSWQSCRRWEYSLRRKLVRAKQGRVSLSTQNLPWLRRQSISNSPSRWWMQCWISWAAVPVRIYYMGDCWSWYFSSSSGQRCTLNRRKGKVRQLYSVSVSCPLPYRTSGLIYTLQSSGRWQSACVKVCGLTICLLTRQTRWKLSTWLAVMYPMRQCAAVLRICSISFGRSLFSATLAVGTLKVRLSLRAGPKMLATVCRGCRSAFFSLPVRIIKISCRTAHSNPQPFSSKAATADHSATVGSLFSSSLRLKAFMAMSSSARRISRFRLSTSDFWMGRRSLRGMTSEESSSTSMGSSLLSGRETSRRTAVQRVRRQRMWLRICSAVRVPTQVASRSQSSPKLFSPSRSRRFSSSVQCLRSLFAISSIIEVSPACFQVPRLNRAPATAQQSEQNDPEISSSTLQSGRDRVMGGWGGGRKCDFSFGNGKLKRDVSNGFPPQSRLTQQRQLLQTSPEVIPEPRTDRMKTSLSRESPPATPSKHPQMAPLPLPPIQRGRPASHGATGAADLNLGVAESRLIFEYRGGNHLLRKSADILRFLTSGEEKDTSDSSESEKSKTSGLFASPPSSTNDHQNHSRAVDLYKFAQFQRIFPRNGVTGRQQPRGGLQRAISDLFGQFQEIGDVEVTLLVGHEGKPDLPGEQDQPFRIGRGTGSADEVQEDPQIDLMLQVLPELPLLLRPQPHPPPQQFLHPQQHPLPRRPPPPLRLPAHPSPLDLALPKFYIIPILGGKDTPVLPEHVLLEADVAGRRKSLGGAGGEGRGDEFLLVDAGLLQGLARGEGQLVQTIQVLQGVHREGKEIFAFLEHTHTWVFSTCRILKIIIKLPPSFLQATKKSGTLSGLHASQSHGDRLTGGLVFRKPTDLSGKTAQNYQSPSEVGSAISKGCGFGKSLPPEERSLRGQRGNGGCGWRWRQQGSVGSGESEGVAGRGWD